MRGFERGSITKDTIISMTGCVFQGVGSGFSDIKSYLSGKLNVESVCIHHVYVTLMSQNKHQYHMRQQCFSPIHPLPANLLNTP